MDQLDKWICPKRVMHRCSPRGALQPIAHLQNHSRTRFAARGCIRMPLVFELLVMSVRIPKRTAGGAFYWCVAAVRLLGPNGRARSCSIRCTSDVKLTQNFLYSDLTPTSETCLSLLTGWRMRSDLESAC